MPELPEVETVVRDLRPALSGRTLLSLRRSRKRLRRPWKADWENQLPGSRVEAVRRRGKWIVIDLNADRHLVVHLGMSGQLLVGEPGRPLSPHVRARFTFADGGPDLRFTDQRTFGHLMLSEMTQDVFPGKEGRLFGTVPGFFLEGFQAPCRGDKWARWQLRSGLARARVRRRLTSRRPRQYSGSPGLAAMGHLPGDRAPCPTIA